MAFMKNLLFCLSFALLVACSPDAAPLPTLAPTAVPLPTPSLTPEDCRAQSEEYIQYFFEFLETWEEERSLLLQLSPEGTTPILLELREKSEKFEATTYPPCARPLMLRFQSVLQGGLSIATSYATGNSDIEPSSFSLSFQMLETFKLISSWESGDFPEHGPVNFYVYGSVQEPVTVNYTIREMQGDRIEQESEQAEPGRSELLYQREFFFEAYRPIQLSVADWQTEPDDWLMCVTIYLGSVVWQDVRTDGSAVTCSF